MEYVILDAGATPLLTTIVNETNLSTLSEAVPETTPVAASMLSQLEPLRANEGIGDPVAVIVNEYGSPIVAPGGDSEVMMGAASEIAVARPKAEADAEARD
nr:hypothetical protein [Cryobacterium mannosilyticum]